MYSSLSISLVAVIAFLLLRRLTGASRREASLPPGPKGLPLIGNLRDIANRQNLLWVTYAQWAQRYGDVFHLKVFGSHTIVLNSHEAITELLEKRSQNYSDRPEMPMLHDLVGGKWQIAFMRYSDSWRLHRKTFHQSFQPSVLPEYHEIQRNEASLLVENLAKSPRHLVEHVNHFAGSIVLKIIYGYNLQTENDPYLQLMHKAVEGLIPAMIFGSFWVDFLPALKHIPAWVPGATFKRKAAVWLPNVEALKEKPWSWVKEAVENGKADPSFCTKVTERLCVSLGDGSDTEDMIKNSAFSAYAAGVETSVSALLSFVLAMMLHPEIQIRAQKEIDSVVGHNNVPDFNDRDRLPYTNAIIAETLRWNPVTPLALPHRALKDDVYAGYFIPAGSTVVGNAWAVLHDEKLYGPNVMEFNPDRFMKPDGNNPPSPENYAFGFGRRICPGKGFALNSLYLAISNILATFTIAKALDENGKEIEPKVQYSDGGTSHPMPYQCRFIPRSPSVMANLERKQAA